MTRKFVTINEAMAICNVSRRTVYNWIQHDLVIVMRTPGGMPRLDITQLLTKHKYQRNYYKENLNGRISRETPKSNQE